MDLTVTLPDGGQITAPRPLIEREGRDRGLNPHAVDAAIGAAETRAAHAVRTAPARAAIEREVGDLASIVGRLADVIGPLLAGQAARTVALADHASNEAQRTELATLQALAGETDIVATSCELLAAIERGDVVLTAAAKPGGLGAAIAAAADASTRTARALARVAGAKPDAPGATPDTSGATPGAN